MADTQNVTLVVVWEDELRKAARLVNQAYNTLAGDGQGDAWRDAMLACLVALNKLGDADDNAIAMLATRPLLAKKGKR